MHEQIVKYNLNIYYMVWTDMEVVHSVVLVCVLERNKILSILYTSFNCVYVHVCCHCNYILACPWHTILRFKFKYYHKTKLMNYTIIPSVTYKSNINEDRPIFRET